LLAIACGPVVSTDTAAEEAGSGDPESTGTGTTEPGTTGSGPDPVTTTALPTTTGARLDVGGVGRIDGPYLLALAAIIDPGHPLQFIAYTRLSGERLDLELTPLTLDVGSTTAPRQPFGDPLFYPGIQVDDGGCFLLDMGEVSLPGPTNPITGSDIAATITLVGCFDPQGYCGTVEGMVHMPIMLDLTGSTFAAVPVDPEMLPTDFPSSC
jgi:hypothetical protein